VAAVIRRLRYGDGSIRLGPDCFSWRDPYTRSLSFEVVKVNVAVIGGLTKSPHSLTREEYRWIERAMIEEGLYMAMERVAENGDVRFRRLPMPSLSKRALTKGRIPNGTS